MTVITGFFDDPDGARSAVRELEGASIPYWDISILAGDADRRSAGSMPEEERTDALGTCASIGGVVGGGAGLLAGLGMLAMPVLGPVAAAGWLASTATGAIAGAAVGGIIGALLSTGMSSDHAEVYAEGIKRGGALVAVRVRGRLAPMVRTILSRYGAIDPDKRLASYRARGWTRSEEGSAPFGGSKDDPGGRPVRYTDMLRH